MPRDTMFVARAGDVAFQLRHRMAAGELEGSKLPSNGTGNLPHDFQVAVSTDRRVWEE
jgi:hypothetical protein